MTITEIVRSVLERVKLFVDRSFSDFNSTHANWTEDDENSIQFIRHKPAKLPANGGNATTVDELSFIEISTDLYASLGSMENSYQDKIYILDKPIAGENDGIIVKPDPEQPEQPEEPEILETRLNLTDPYYANISYKTLDANTISIYGGHVGVVRYQVTVNPSKSHSFSCICSHTDNSVFVFTGQGTNTIYHFQGEPPVNVEIPAGHDSIYIDFYAVGTETEIVFSEIALIEKN